MKEILALLVRHGLTLVGGATLATDDTVTQIVGALVTLGAVAWSIWQKKKAK